MPLITANKAIKNRPQKTWAGFANARLFIAVLGAMNWSLMNNFIRRKK